MLLAEGARAHIRNSNFRDLELEQEIFDVSFGSSVRLENCTFTNITVPNNDYVSTSYNDWEFREGISYDMIYYPEDDEGPSFDVLRHRANDSSIPEGGAYTSLVYFALMGEKQDFLSLYVSAQLIFVSHQCR
jgi:hypothetical protein